MRRLHLYKLIVSGVLSLLLAMNSRGEAQQTVQQTVQPPAQQATGASPADGPSPAVVGDGEQGVVLLQDGGVLEGQVTRAADWYLVTRGGGQMQVAASRVLFVGRTLHEAYEHRARQTSLPTGETHLALAEWCLRYGLVDEAQIELEKAKSIGARSGRRQLVEKAIVAAKARQGAKSAVTPAAYTQAGAGEQVEPPRGISRELPDGALELFTRKVQPILVNNCTASRCHQPGGEQSFQLNRAVLRGEGNRQTTMKNLYATLALVDRAQPEASRLLTLPRQTHGGMNGPIFGVRQQQAFQHLADWVALVAPAQPPKEAGAAGAAAKGAAVKGAAVKGAAVKGAGALAPGLADAEPSPFGVPRHSSESAIQQAAAIEREPIESLRTPHRLRYGQALKSWQPRDAFDPEIFNRESRQGPGR
jgi:hypothetical protein